MSKPHKHADVIHAYADGAEIEYFAEQAGKWCLCATPSFVEDTEYRVKPSAPEYPRSAISDMALSEVWSKANPTLIGTRLVPVFDGCIAKACADAGLRHACETQQVVPMADVQEVARNLAQKELRKAEALACIYKTPCGTVSGPADAISWVISAASMARAL